MKEFMIAVVKIIRTLLKEVYRDLFDSTRKQIKP